LATGRDIQSLDDPRAALSYALADVSPEVRDAAVQALASSPDRAVARSLLVARRAVEDVPFLKDAIDEALEDLGEP